MFIRTLVFWSGLTCIQICIYIYSQRPNQDQIMPIAMANTSTNEAAMFVNWRVSVSQLSFMIYWLTSCDYFWRKAPKNPAVTSTICIIIPVPVAQWLDCSVPRNGTWGTMTSNGTCRPTCHAAETEISASEFKVVPFLLWKKIRKNMESHRLLPKFQSDPSFRAPAAAKVKP